jgi:hypothetical protein
MPRSNRPRRSKSRSEEQPEISRSVLFGARRTEVKRGIEYTVQSHSGSSLDDDKSWKCPYCRLLINRGTSHMVAWDERGSGVRRHFHTSCWTKFQGPLE